MCSLMRVFRLKLSRLEFLEENLRRFFLCAQALAIWLRKKIPLKVFFLNSQFLHIDTKCGAFDGFC